MAILSTRSVALARTAPKQTAIIAALFAASLTASIATPALAAPDGDLTYAVASGDTLYDLSKDYMTGATAMQEIRTLNAIANPRRLQIGKQLKLPRRLMKYQPVKLDLQSFSGPVTVERNGRTVPASLGYAIEEGVIINTGAKGFAAIAGSDGALVTIPSNSRVQIIDARRYLINDKIDVQIKVLQGRGEVRAPKIEGDARFRMGTPIAVTAVRGTEFRVAHSADTNRSLTEVIEGEVRVSNGEQLVDTSAGFGVASAAAGIGANEKLLASPELVEPGAIQTQETVEFVVQDLANASSYRTQLARDAGFTEVITELVSNDAAATFAEVPDGRFYVRSRAVSQSGLEGLAKAYSFRRKRVGAEAGIETSPFADAFKFAWRSQGSGQSYAGFQLWEASQPDVLIIDEVGLEKSALLAGNLVAGDYRWRVATFQIDEGDVIKVWAPTQELVVAE
ncbi:MAG: FecR domain-containing protein [Erythrobacter sp.]